MSRIRSIKPAIHLDEELWDLEQETGLPLFRTFTALWSEADREGRFEWRPRKLKAACLPYWDGDFLRVLHALSTRGFIVQYAHQGREYGWVRTFTRHQIINNREAPSVLPPCPEESSTCIVPARVEHASSTREVHALVEGKGREYGREDHASTAREENPPVAALPRDPESEALKLLRIGYAKRYEQLTSLLWNVGTNHKSLQQVAAWCEATAKQQSLAVGQVTGTVLQEFFLDDRAAKAQWPWAWLAENPGKYFLRNRAAQEHIATRKGVV